MGGFPSGQRGQTVNLLSTTSVVRIHHLPPKKRVQICALFCFTLKIENRSSGFESRLLATCWMHVATGVAFPQKSESTTFHQRREYKSVLSFVLCGKQKSPYQGKSEKPYQLIPALSVAARHLSQRERQVWIARKRKKPAPASRLSLRESWHLRSK